MKLRIFLSGCFGRMGRTIGEIADGSDDIAIVAGSDLVEKPCNFPVYKDPRLCCEDFDVLVDFSNVSALPAVFDLIKLRRCPSVICTTGLDPSLQSRLQDLAKHAAVFQSANMSLGINLLLTLAKQAAQVLYPADFDIEIVEAHHNQKLDAPSGTAMMLARGIDDSLGGQMQYVHDRSEVRQKREHREIGISAIRGGTIVGEHSVIFAGQDEVITLHHSAQSRAVLGRGALTAARFIFRKPAGLYNMTDLVSSLKSK